MQSMLSMQSINAIYQCKVYEMSSTLLHTGLNEDDNMDGSRVALQGIFAQFNFINIKERREYCSVLGCRRLSIILKSYLQNKKKVKAARDSSQY